MPELLSAGATGTLLPHGPPLPILMYHHVRSDGDGPKSPLDVPSSVFERQLDLLVEGGALIAGVSEALRLRQLGGVGRRVVGITIDDGYADARHAAELILARGGTVSLYVPTDLVGQKTDDRGLTDRRLSWDELAELSRAGVELGSHSCSHRPLDTMDEESLRHELAASRSVLEARICAPVISVCYPHGYTSSRVTRIAAETGYVNGCVVGRRLATGGDVLLGLPRVQPTRDMTDQQFLDLLDHGERGWTPRLKRAAQPAWRGVRRAARHLGLDLT